LLEVFHKLFISTEGRFIVSFTMPTAAEGRGSASRLSGFHYDIRLPLHLGRKFDSYRGHQLPTSSSTTIQIKIYVENSILTGVVSFQHHHFRAERDRDILLNRV
jgi:hypothetical protein